MRKQIACNSCLGVGIQKVGNDKFESPLPHIKKRQTALTLFVSFLFSQASPAYTLLSRITVVRSMVVVLLRLLNAAMMMISRITPPASHIQLSANHDGSTALLVLEVVVVVVEEPDVSCAMAATDANAVKSMVSNAVNDLFIRIGFGK